MALTTNHTTNATAGSGAAAFTHEERLSRQRAAERLADIAYALTVTC